MAADSADACKPQCVDEGMSTAAVEANGGGGDAPCIATVCERGCNIQTMLLDNKLGNSQSLALQSEGGEVIMLEGRLGERREGNIGIWCVL